MAEIAERRPRPESGAPNDLHSNGYSVTREKELRAAIEKASVPVSDYRVYHALLNRAEWNSAVIPVRFQPRSLEELAEMSKVSLATVKRTLSHLQRHGWILRHRHLTDKGIGGRGHPTRYELAPGRDCDCIPQRPEPVSDAVRAKRYRQRKKAAHDSVTGQPDKAAHVIVTHNSKAAQIDVTTGEKAAQFDVTNRLTSRDDTAGQAAFSAKEGRDEGSIEERQPETTGQHTPDLWGDWPPESNGAAANPWPAARIPGARGKQIPADPETREAIRVLLDAFGPVEIIGSGNQ